MSDGITIEQAKAAKRRLEEQQEQEQSPYVDADNQRIRPDTTAGRISEQYLTAREGVTLREEAVTVKGRAKEWHAVVEEFEDYVWRQWKSSQTWEEQKGVASNSHRFTEKSSKDRYARTLGVDRAACDLWGDDVTTVHVVRRASAFGRQGQPQPPADHLDDLLSSNGNVYAAYRRHIEDNHGLKYARLTVLEPHRNGYAHAHDGLWVKDPDGVVSEIDTQPAVEAHVRGVRQADPLNHAIGSTVSVEHDPDRDGFDGDPVGVPVSSALPRELTKYLGGLAPHNGDTEQNPDVPSVLQSDTGPLRFYALLWATGRQQWRPDSGYFPQFVELSQEKYDTGTDETDETYPVPEDIDSEGGSPDTVSVDGRPVAFEKQEGGRA